MPENLSPAVGYGNPVYHQAAIEVRYDPRWRVSPQLPAYPPTLVEEAPPVQTGNAATITELEALNDGFDSHPPREGEGDEEPLSAG